MKILFCLALALFPAAIWAQEQPAAQAVTLRDYYLEYEVIYNRSNPRLYEGLVQVFNKKTKKLVQTLKTDCFGVEHGEKSERWVDVFGVGDFNFDGFEDFSCSEGMGNVNASYAYFLFDPRQKKFREAFSLSGYDIDFDPVNKTATAESRGSCCSRSRTIYHVKRDRLVPKLECEQYIGQMNANTGISVTLAGPGYAMAVIFIDDMEAADTENTFSGHVSFSENPGNAVFSGNPAGACLLGLKEKKILSRSEAGEPSRVAWTLDVRCADKAAGTLFFWLSDEDDSGNVDELLKARYRPPGDDKEVALEWGYTCRDCGVNGKNCEPGD
ncbi:MAG: hypothetical protein LBQ81_12060 [Zoogloeaceae bacterium]|jgi:hypothetical protein|nr:hypothetical protein [Zoogloeaceae bacterium]